MADFTRRDIEDTVWSVLTSFAFSEEESETEKERFFLLDKTSAKIKSTVSEKARAEAVALCIETAFACGLEKFCVKLSDKAVFDLLVLFGFENILIFDGDIKNGFKLFYEDIPFAGGIFSEEKTTANIDLKAICDICKGGENDLHKVSKSLVFAEEQAEGAAYDICYNLRVNGCIVEMYNAAGDIKSACRYAEKEGHSAVVRCFKDGTVEIKDLVKNEITKTSVSEFLGYYDDCDCSSEEHNHHDCDCGHHHN